MGRHAVLPRLTRGKQCRAGHDGGWLPQVGGFFCATCRDADRKGRRVARQIERGKAWAERQKDMVRRITYGAP